MVRTTAQEQLRSWIERTKHTPIQVADALLISRPHLVHLTTGRRSPSLALAGRIAALTGIPESAWRRVA